jgi:NAD(P)-dependent dehydrogenase (short-subunit alcohol dehydrogenase family)
MRGKTVLFTRASRGKGRLAAIELARLGAEILVVGHNQARGEAAVEAIYTGRSAQVLRADMGNAAEVCALAETVLARNERIYVWHADRPLPARAASPPLPCLAPPTMPRTHLAR